MEEKLERKSAIEYFLKYAKENVLACFHYFKNLPMAEENKRKIFSLDKTDPSFPEQLLFVYTSLDVHYQSNVFVKSEPTLEDEMEVVAKAVSPIPSVQLTGNLIL